MAEMMTAKELSKYAKRANQRLLRLERWEEKEGYKPTDAHRLALFYLDGKKRFTESKSSIEKMSEKDIRALQKMVSNFLNDPASEVRYAKKERELSEYLRKQQRRRSDDEEGSKTVNPFIDDDERRSKAFWRIYKRAKNGGLMKAFNYKTVARAISWALKKTPAIMLGKKEKRLNKAIDDLVDKVQKQLRGEMKGEELSRQDLLAAIAKA